MKSSRAGVMKLGSCLLALQITVVCLWSCAEGAAYHGTSPSDAKKVIDASEGVVGWHYSNPGHPRGHSYNPTPPNVQEYSQGGVKSGFLSRADQDFAIHYALLHPDSQKAMSLLNAGSDREVVDIPAAELAEVSGQQAAEWRDGSKGPDTTIRTITLVLQHHKTSSGGRQPDTYQVHMQTGYPRVSGLRHHEW